MKPKLTQPQPQDHVEAQSEPSTEATARRRLRGRAVLILLIDLAVIGGSTLALLHSVHLALVVAELAVFAVSVPHALLSLHRAVIGHDPA